ncbi:hypothetical protein KKF86_01455 [bacterium]|nr:hypothetical protein [bacterium]
MNEIKNIFTRIFNKYAPVPLSVIDTLIPLFDICTIEKGTEIASQRKINSKDYFLLRGILREFTIDENGNETTLDFYLGESIIVPNFCRTTNNRSILTIQAQVKSIVAKINVTVFENIRNEYPELIMFSSSVIIDLYKSKLQKQIFHATKSGKEKLEQLRKDFPGIENYVPLPYIASYIGITNVSLSRLRKPK